jgi:hypothetical protein
MLISKKYEKESDISFISLWDTGGLYQLVAFFSVEEEKR